MKGCVNSYLFAPRLGWIELRAPSRRIAVLLNDASVAVGAWAQPKHVLPIKPATTVRLAHCAAIFLSSTT
jgi:hypothetical protein